MAAVYNFKKLILLAVNSLGQHHYKLVNILHIFCKVERFLQRCWHIIVKKLSGFLQTSSITGKHRAGVYIDLTPTTNSQSKKQNSYNYCMMDTNYDQADHV